MPKLHKLPSGFTIVELLIVIVVIAILAAITVVAYEGMQLRAKNSQTQQALTSWVKALQLYKADKGSWPGAAACLGEGYPYGFSGNDTSGGQCRYTTYGVTENPVFVAMMKPYISSLPTPAFVVAGRADTSWFRGATYIYGGGGDGKDVYVQAVYAGNVDCPVAGGITATVQTQNLSGSGNTHCYYPLGRTTDS